MLTLIKKDAYIVVAVLLESGPIRPVYVRKSSLSFQHKQSTERPQIMDAQTVVFILLVVYAIAEFIRSYGLLLLAVGLIATLTIAWRRHA